MNDDLPSLTQILALIASSCGLIAFVYVALRAKLIVEAVNAMFEREAAVLNLTERDVLEMFQLDDDEPMPLWMEEIWLLDARVSAATDMIFGLERRIEWLLWVGIALPWGIMVIAELLRAGFIGCNHLFFLAVVTFLAIHTLANLGNIEPKPEDYR